MLKRAILAPSVVLALGIGVAGYAAGGLAFADPSGAATKSTDRVAASEGASQFAMSARTVQLADSSTPPGPRDRQVNAAGRPGNRDQPPSEPARPPGGPGRFGPLGGQMLAAASLSAMETYLGIRADQFDAWRAYTNAVMALLQLPRPPQDEPKPAAFDRAEAIATRIADQGTKAQAVLTALSALKAKLTDEQMQRAVELSASLPPLPPPGPMSLAMAFGAPAMPGPPPMAPQGADHGPNGVPAQPGKDDDGSQRPQRPGPQF
ncbi:hypothetical protein V5F77_15895 [Xanthobacter sp. DSM 24535]|uniref:hypothetical protein n=1 Tax=Roseixanthobacter psychrophilus TaxID=3119917 RepID=UPI0037283C50